MKICVVNGSPRGKYSVTLQTALYLEQKFPAHDFSFLNAAQEIRSFEKDLRPALDRLLDADLLIFTYPVYTFLAPAQLHRFIRLLKQSGETLAGKYVTQITTSKHFYDVTAHRYVEENCHDLGMRVIHGLSADMEDLLTEQGQKDAERFLRYAVYCVDNQLCEPAPERRAQALPEYTKTLSPGPKKDGFDTVIVADLREGDRALAAMIEDFQAAYPYPTRLVNLAEYPFQGGCLGCFRCAGDGVCVYRDGFDRFLREQIQSADATVYAFSIQDHSMGVTFKTYDDRQFCNGHRTVTEGMPFGYLVRGDYGAEENLRTVIEARCQVGHSFLAGVGTDAGTIAAVARRLSYALENRYVQPRNFYGVGGMKIFRDLIWLMRGLMKADHVFYKEHGAYDFPQKQRGKMIKMSVLGALIRNPKVKAKLGNQLDEGMVAPYKKVLDGAKSAR